MLAAGLGSVNRSSTPRNIERAKECWRKRAQSFIPDKSSSTKDTGTSDPSGLCSVTLWSETGERLGFILKGRDNVCHMDNPQDFLHSTTRTEQFQATALAVKRDIRLDDGTDARTIQLRYVFQVQQQFPHALGDQFFQLDVQQVAVDADCRFSPEVQNSDISGFPNCDLKAHTMALLAFRLMD